MIDLVENGFLVAMSLLAIPAIVLPATALLEVWFWLRGREYIQPIEQISKENDYE